MAEYQKLTVVKLKELLKDRGLPVTGKKADLVERLEEHDAQVVPADENELNRETNDANGGDSTKEDALQAVPIERELLQEPSVEPSPGNIAQEKHSRLQQEEAAIRDSVVAQETETPASQEIENVTMLAEVDLQDNAQSPKAIANPQDDTKSSIIDSAQIQSTEDDPQPSTNDSHTDEAMEQTDEKDLGGNGDTAQIEDQHKTVAPAAIDHEAMPAPELPATQLPRPSIETQQTQELKQESQSAEPNLGFEAITRTATMSSANTQEILEDRNKRKRRSHSPSISMEEVALKKAKALDGTPRATSIVKDQEITTIPVNMEVDSPNQPDNKRVSSDTDMPISENKAQEALHESSKSPNTQMLTEQEQQAAPVSRHPPTNCLYINNLMRPLQPNALRAHLEELAHPDTQAETEITSLFFLEATRRYGLASFSSVSMAVRARAGLHDQVWPNESNRKALFVDFVPEDKARALVQMEEENASKPRQQRKRFEILYIDDNGKITPEIHDADSTTAIQYRAKQTSSSTTTKLQAHAPVALPPPPREESGKNFKALDELFPSTSTKPRVYYLPISTEIAEKRLNTLSRALMPSDMVKNSTATDEKRRYTFEDSEIVDKGPEFGFGRGGGGGGAGRGRGGFAGDRGERGAYHGRGRGGPRGEYRGDYRSGAGIGYHERR